MLFLVTKRVTTMMGMTVVMLKKIVIMMNLMMSRVMVTLTLMYKMVPTQNLA